MRLTIRAARTGRQGYGTHDEMRDASEVFAAASLASWVGVPVTVGHRGWLTRENVDSYAIGFVASVERDRGDGDGIEFVRAVVRLMDERAIEQVRAGKLTDWSAGYEVLLTEDELPRQTGIRVNHLAILPPGAARCGEACTILP